MLPLIAFFTVTLIGIASIVVQVPAAVAPDRGAEYRWRLTSRFVHWLHRGGLLRPWPRR